MSIEYARDVQATVDKKRSILSKAERIAREIKELDFAMHLIDQGETIKLAYDTQDKTKCFTVEQMPYLFKVLLQDQITKKRAEIEELMKGLA